MRCAGWLRADYVKVDGTVVRNVRRSASAAAKLRAILRAGVGVIAECVEDDKCLSALKLLKIGYAQGFAVGRPQPIDALSKS